MSPVEHRGRNLRALKQRPHANSVSEQDGRHSLTVLETPVRDGHEKALQGVFALRENGDVEVHIPKHMQPFVGPEFLTHLHKSVKRAYLAGMQGQPSMSDNTRPDDVPDYPSQPASDYMYDDEESLLDEPIKTRRPALCRTCDRASCERHSRSTQDIDNQSPRPDRISADSDDGNSTVLSHNMKRLRISSEAQVVAFLEDRLERIQQLTAKKIAKAWIKGICPKKQARFPYQNAKRERDEGLKPDIPPWWPIDLCGFKEPDHIQKEPRKRLLVHLLRLRPSSEELVEWNGEAFDAHKTHERRGWTAFLQELAPIETVATVDNHKPEKVEKRRQYLKDLYAVAEMEEDHQRTLRVDGVGMDVFYDYSDDDRTAKPMRVKRQRRADSIVLSPGELSSTRSLSAPPCEGHVHVKRRHLNSDAKPILRIKTDGQSFRPIPNSEEAIMGINIRQQAPQESLSIPMEVDGAAAVEEAVKPDRNFRILGSAVSKQSRSSIPLQAQWQASRQNITPANEYNRRASEAQWQTAGPPSTAVSFGSAISDMVSFDQFQSHHASQPSCMGRNDCATGQYPPHTHLPAPSPSLMQVHHVAQIPQPQFTTVPNTPLFSSSNLMYENGMPFASPDGFPSSMAAPLATMPYHIPQGPINCNHQFTSTGANDVQQQPYDLQAPGAYHNSFGGLPFQPMPTYQSESQWTSLSRTYQHPDEKAIGFHN